MRRASLEVSSTPEAMQQACDASEGILIRAVRDIDAYFGVGYAENNPAMVVGYMQAASVDFFCYVLSQEVKVLADSIDSISGAIDAHGG